MVMIQDNKLASTTLKHCKSDTDKRTRQFTNDTVCNRFSPEYVSNEVGTTSHAKTIPSEHRLYMYM